MASEVELESAKWLNEHLVVCELCESSTFHMSDYCNLCHTPLAISTAVQSSNHATRFIPILGTSGVGKTTYTAMLLELLRHDTEIQANLDRPSTRALQRQTLSSLFQRRFPQPTPMDPEHWHWVQSDLVLPTEEPTTRKGFSMFGRNEDEDNVVSWLMPDLPGLVVEQAINHQDYCPVVIKIVSKATGLLLLVDAMRAAVEPADQHQDELATQLATFVRNHARCAGLNSVLVDIPVAIVFTKTDRCPAAADDPKAFAKRQLPRFYETIHMNIRHYQFFGANVAGGVTRIRDDHFIPFQIQPKGVVEPFAWVINTQTSSTKTPA